jgi:hypothetical protein
MTMLEGRSSRQNLTGNNRLTILRPNAQKQVREGIKQGNEALMKIRSHLGLTNDLKEWKNGVNKLMLSLERNGSGGEGRMSEDWFQINGAVHKTSDCQLPVTSTRRH